MTIKEIIGLQDSGECLYLLRQGLFFRGYNQAGAFLHEAAGYRLKAVVIKSCGAKPLFYAGFPATVLEKIIEMALQRGGAIEWQENGNVAVVSGVSVAYDEAALLAATPPLPERHCKAIAEAIHLVLPVDCFTTRTSWFAMTL